MRTSLCLATLCLCLFLAAGTAKAKDLPKFEHVEQFVQRYYHGQPSFEAGDLLSRSRVEPVLSGLKQMGWAVPDAKAVLASVPADNSFLVRELYSPEGLRFMRKVDRYPMAYDRLERLARLPNGRRTVHDLIHGKGGEKMVEYLTISRGGREMGKMLSKIPAGTSFNQPTGKVYTVQALITRLRESHRLSEKTRQEQLASAASTTPDS